MGHYGIPKSNVRENLESVRFRAILRNVKLQPVLPGISYGKGVMLPEGGIIRDTASGL